MKDHHESNVTDLLEERFLRASIGTIEEQLRRHHVDIAGTLAAVRATLAGHAPRESALKRRVRTLLKVAKIGIAASLVSVFWAESEVRPPAAVTARNVAHTSVADPIEATPVPVTGLRTWVSGVGDDVLPCSRTEPCKTFAGAISKSASTGEISILDPGGFGAVTITKAITIGREPFPVLDPELFIVKNLDGNLGPNQAPSIEPMLAQSSATVTRKKLTLITDGVTERESEAASSGRFTTDTWDITANDAHFFVRDVIGASRLSLRGAAAESIDFCAAEHDQLAPAATLLLPHFEVEVDAASETTFTIANTSYAPQVTRVILWTDGSMQLLNFNAFLTGYDNQAISLYDVVHSFPSAGISPSMISACTTGRAADEVRFDEVRFDDVLFDNPVVGDSQQISFATHAPEESGWFRYLSIEPSPIDGSAGCRTQVPTRHWVIVSPSVNEWLDPDIRSARYEVSCSPPFVCTPPGDQQPWRR